MVAVVAVLLVLGVGGARAGDVPQRIVSLAPSLTEILFASGAGGRVVGVSDYCDFPAEAEKLPRIGGMSNPSLEAIVSLRPDLVVMTVDGNPAGLDERLLRMGIAVYVVRERRLDALPSAIRGIGAAAHAPDAERVAADIEKRIAAAVESANERTARGAKALFIIWPEPLMAAGPGTLIDDALDMLGYENIAEDAASNYPKYSIEEAIRRAPDVIFIGASMGNMAETSDLRALSEKLIGRLGSIPAVQSGRVYYLSDRLFRLGPRAIDGLYELMESEAGGKK